ncbi:hypothetical protein BpHYR1_004005 [Brachionus plicatilis]|uniref:Uncharacterized protein n=1 Tax=Brachionus plicatilis TaxID=10195 RepID=A0A3M7T0P1_BRAPC|nr:hypothetical protein BpHYR1_004005 [Brachionus plicatilis]
MWQIFNANPVILYYKEKNIGHSRIPFENIFKTIFIKKKTAKNGISKFLAGLMTVDQKFDGIFDNPYYTGFRKYGQKMTAKNLSPNVPVCSDHIQNY